jgi:hypothetical protein
MSGDWTLHPSKVYLAMNTISVQRLGLPDQIYTNQILSLHPSELSSQVLDCSWTTPEAGPYFTCWRAARSFNFADLQGSVPASVYFAGGDRKALFNGKSHDTIVDGNYWPVISLPAAVTNINTDLFKSCSIFASRTVKGKVTLEHPGIWDPPLTLTALTGTTLGIPNIPATALRQHIPTITASPSAAFDPHMVAQETRYPVASEEKERSEITLPLTPYAARSTVTALPASIQNQLGSQSLYVGGPVATLGGMTISRAPGGGFVIDSHIIHDAAQSTQSPAHAKSNMPATLTELPSFLRGRIGSKTLLPGSAMTVDDTVVSRDNDGNFLVEASSGSTKSVRTKKSGTTSLKARARCSLLRSSLPLLAGICLLV